MLLTALAPELVDDFPVDEVVDAPAGSFVSWVLELPPGPDSLALLCSLDVESLDARERLLVLQAWERQHGWLSAQLQAATVAAAGPEPTVRDDWAQDEVCAGLPRDAVATVEATVLPKAPAQTVPAFRRSLRRAVLAAAPEQAEEAAQHALAEDVDVRIDPLPNGLAAIVATMPAVEARELFLAVNTLAKARHAAEGGKRGGVRIGRRRVDVLTALAWAALADRGLPTTHGRRAELQVIIDLPTLLRLADNPAELLDYGATTYRPPQAMVDHVTARDRHCCFPGCANPAGGCDLDHAVNHPAGTITWHSPPASPTTSHPKTNATHSRPT